MSAASNFAQHILWNEQHQQTHWAAPQHASCIEHRHPDNACTREGSLVRVGQTNIRQSVETEAEAVAPVVQQSASRSQQPIHAETSVGGTGHRARLAPEHQHHERRTHTFLLLPLPSLAHQAALRPAKESSTSKVCPGMHTYTRRRDTHKVPEDDDSCSSAHRALLPGKFFEEKKRGGGGQGDPRQLSQTRFAAKPHSTSRTRLLRRRKK